MASRGRRRRLAVRFLSESDVLWVDYGCWIRELYPSREAEMVPYNDARYIRLSILSINIRF